MRGVLTAKPTCQIRAVFISSMATPEECETRSMFCEVTISSEAGLPLNALQSEYHTCQVPWQLVQFFSLDNQHVGCQEVSLHSMFQVPEVQLLNSFFVFDHGFGISTSCMVSWSEGLRQTMFKAPTLGLLLMLGHEQCSPI